MDECILKNLKGIPQSYEYKPVFGVYFLVFTNPFLTKYHLQKLNIASLFVIVNNF